MVKGGLLKDDANWATLGVKEGQKLMMMGTADEIVKTPEKGPVFMEDLPEEEQMVAVGHTAGLFNLGNTCYMNSTVQCLHSVPELKSALVSYPSQKSSDLDHTSHMLTAATRELFNELDKSVKPVAPMQFWMVLRKKYPQFGQLHNGVYMQQDAEECWTQLLYTLSQSLRSPSFSSENPDTIKALFGIELVSRVHCQESGEESSETESVYSLKCHISQEVNHLHEGLKHGLKSELEKASPCLGRSAIYLKESRINALPRHIFVFKVPNCSVCSFFLEEGIKSEGQDFTGNRGFLLQMRSDFKSSVSVKVDYPLQLDVYDFCSDDLCKKLEAPRQILRDEEGKKAGLKAKEKTSGSKDNDVKMTDVERPSNESGESSKPTSKEGGPTDKKSHLTGIYDLVAVLTHKGRSADSGHYVAWVKQESGKWIEFDDDNPVPQREEDITKLSGGGDWHMAYICMYKARTVPM
ncbi:ubiquitin carboxyl-terminal hydrolase 7-like isoform X1 [Populus alba x Populus x berolinensis]|nr:ubiquitin carboxyl-terminal hydrolase 7-like isoform X1 [Populus alba x Populus x berolinensis]